MKNQKGSLSTAVNFGRWGWFLIILCMVYQMLYSAFAVDGINGYGTSLAGYLSQTSGQSIIADMLTVVLTPIGIICCLAGFIFTSLVMRFGTKIVAVIACYGMGRILRDLGFAIVNAFNFFAKKKNRETQAFRLAEQKCRTMSQEQ